MPIEAVDLCYTYSAPGAEPFTALDGVSLHLADGGFTGVMGRTGCGKTTLLCLLAGLLTPTSGRVLLDGRDIGAAGFDRRVLRRDVGVLFQRPERQLFETTVEKDVAFGLKHSGLDSGAVAARVRRALGRLGFGDDVLHASPLALSGGEKHRVAMAGILAAEPRFLLLDEPTAGLDPQGRKDVLSLLTQLQREGTTIVMISHDADALCEHADSILVLAHGRLALSGPTREVFSRLPGLAESPSDGSTPQEIARILAARGAPLAGDILTYGELLDALARRLNGGEKT